MQELGTLSVIAHSRHVIPLQEGRCASAAGTARSTPIRLVCPPRRAGRIDRARQQPLSLLLADRVMIWAD